MVKKSAKEVEKKVKQDPMKKEDVEKLREKVELLELKAKQFRSLLTVIESQQKDAAETKTAAKKTTKKTTTKKKK